MTTNDLNLYQKAVTNLIALLLAFNLVSCAAVQGDPYVTQPGFVEPVRWTAVMSGMRNALLENSRALIMFNPNNGMVLFGWPRSGGWAWTVLDSSFKSAANALHAAGGAGNLMSCSDFSCLIGGAERIGYRQVTPADLWRLAPAFCESVMAQTISFAQGALTSVFVMPAGVVPADPWAEGVQ